MSEIRWNSDGTRGATADGHRIAVLQKPGVRIRVVQVINPPGGRLTELVTAVEEGGDCAAEAQRLVDTQP